MVFICILFVIAKLRRNIYFLATCFIENINRVKNCNFWR